MTIIKVLSRASLAISVFVFLLGGISISAFSTAPSPSASPSAATSAPTSTPPSPGPAPEVVLRMETGGGIVPFGFFITQLPTFTLYSDDTVVLRPTTDDTETGLPPLWQAQLTSEQADELVRFALEEGGLATASGHYQNPGVADVPTTVFTVHTDEMAKTVSADGLGIGPRGRDRDQLRKLERLAAQLADFESEILAAAIEHRLYEPARYRAALMEADPEQPGAMPWPWTDLVPEDFVSRSNVPAQRLAALDSEDVALVTNVPFGGHPGILLAGPDGAAYSLAIRPLLPDESLVPIPPAEGASGQRR